MTDVEMLQIALKEEEKAIKLYQGMLSIIPISGICSSHWSRQSKVINK